MKDSIYFNLFWLLTPLRQAINIILLFLLTKSLLMIAYLGAGGRQSNVLLVIFEDWRVSVITNTDRRLL